MVFNKLKRSTVDTVESEQYPPILLVPPLGRILWREKRGEDFRGLRRGYVGINMKNGSSLLSGHYKYMHGAEMRSFCTSGESFAIAKLDASSAKTWHLG